MQMNRYGYIHLILSHRGARLTITAHRVIAITFLGPVPDGKTVDDHIDGDKLNNRVTNLRYLTPSEQMLSAKRLGLFASGDRHPTRMRPEIVSRGADHPRALLNERIVRAMRRLHVAGHSYAYLADLFDVSISVASCAVTRKTWKHLA